MFKGVFNWKRLLNVISQGRKPSLSRSALSIANSSRSYVLNNQKGSSAKHFFPIQRHTDPLCFLQQPFHAQHIYTALVIFQNDQVWLLFGRRKTTIQNNYSIDLFWVRNILENIAFLYGNSNIKVSKVFPIADGGQAGWREGTTNATVLS